MNERNAVYMLASKKNGTLYIGVTSNLPLRVEQHVAGVVPGFTQRYGVTRLVWFERHRDIHEAIAREKQLKGWNRAWKTKLIEAGNPDRLELVLSV
jgi:putative endonuclease